MKETDIKSLLSKYFKTADNALGFYAIQIKKPKMGIELVFAALSPRVAGRVAADMFEYYVLGISEEGVFYSKAEGRSLREAKTHTWEDVEHVKIVEGFMSYKFKFILMDGTDTNFKIQKTAIGLNHVIKTQELKTLLHSINKLKSN
jgi:hypothetical protein